MFFGQARQEKTAISTAKPVYISSSLIISCKLTGGRRSRKKPQITRVPEVQKPNFPRKIQTGKLDESSTTKLPSQDIWSISQDKESTVPRAIFLSDCSSGCLTARPNCLWAGLVALIS